MSRDPPPSRHEKKTLSLLPLTRVVRGPNNIWFPAPYRAIPVRVPYQFPLLVGVVVEENAEYSEGDNCRREREPQLIRVVSEIEGGTGVD